jgi:hypothetical protein
MGHRVRLYFSAPPGKLLILTLTDELLSAEKALAGPEKCRCIRAAVSELLKQLSSHRE